MTKDTLTFDEACAYLNTSPTTLTDLVATGNVAAAKIGMRWVFRKADIDAYLSEQIALQTEARRAAYQSGKAVKICTAVGDVRRQRGHKPVLPALPCETTA